MKRLIALSVALLCGAVAATAGGHYFRHFGIKDGLSQVRIPSICQDELGTMWFGTSEGLNRYNGLNIRQLDLVEGGGIGLTSTEIEQLCSDGRGHIYIRSGDDLMQLDIYRERFSLLQHGDVRSLYCARDTLWVACSDGIFYRAGDDSLRMLAPLNKNWGAAKGLIVREDTIFVATQRKLAAFSRRNIADSKVLASYRRGNCLTATTGDDLWVGTWEGLLRVRPDGSVSRYTSGGTGGLTDNQVRCLLEDDNGRLWLGTFQGLDCYDPAADTWYHHTRYGDSPNVLSHHSVLSLHKDRQGSIWVGTYYGGVNVFDPNNEGSRFFHAEPMLEDCLSFPVVGKMTEDGDGNLWICTEGGGLNRYDAATESFVRWRSGNGSKNKEHLKAIYYCAANNRLYVGTHLDGLWVIDMKSGAAHSMHHSADDPASLPHEIVNDIQEYRGRLAILTQGGPVLMDPVSETFSPLVEDEEIQHILNREYAFETFLIDRRDRMWLAFSDSGVLCVDLKTLRMERYDDPSAEGRSKVAHIFEDSVGDVWFCSLGSGLFRWSDREGGFEHHVVDGRNMSDYCYYICESDEDGKFYVLHNHGVSLCDRRTGLAESTRHMFHQTYSQGSAIYRNGRGSLFVSGTNGLSLVSEDIFKTHMQNILVYDRLFVYNDEIHPGDGSGILSEILARTPEIRLASGQNNITVEFATFDYNDNPDRLYEYSLRGFDDTWTQTSGTNITFHRLPPGSYRLCTRAVDDPDSEIELGIRIAAPFYATVWAWILYLLLVIGIAVLILRIRTSQSELKASFESERREKERIEEVNRMKIEFFSNISHEFRTPLTLILGQMEMLMYNEELPPSAAGRIARIQRNAEDMRNLIGELLDFRKTELGYLKLRVAEHDIVGFVRQIYSSFKEQARRQNMEYRFDSAEESILLWFDSRQMQKVVVNLLSNAFKYSSPDGSVSVEIRKGNSDVTIAILDTGIGIPEEDVERIFDRFYQAGNSSSVATGSGIGLALSKSIVDLHHGSLTVESRVGEGSRFVITLLRGFVHFNEGELASGTEEMPILATASDGVEVQPPFGSAVYENDAEDGQPAGAAPSVLIVEDNAELLELLCDLFAPMYMVYKACNGRDGLNMVRSLRPDLVVSDVMMPGMTGKELCYTIKKDISLANVSVVLLTAQTSADQMVEGFMFGADDYVTKPFDMKVLLARCNSILRNKRQLLASGCSQLSALPEVGAVSERDRRLVEKCEAIVRLNFSNPDLDVITLARELALSRSKLYVEIKRITGLTPNEFIIKVKLDEAMALLQGAPELNVSEIAFKLGFSSARYFSRTFKSVFGVSPQSVRRGAADMSPNQKK